MRQCHVLNGMTERPVSDVVQQSRHDENFRIMARNNVGKARVSSKLPKVPECVVIDTERVFETRVCGSRIHMRRQSQLRNMPQSLKLRGIHDGPHTGRKRDVLLGRNSDDAESDRKSVV